MAWVQDSFGAVQEFVAGPGSAWAGFFRYRNWSVPGWGRSRACRSASGSSWNRCCATATASASTRRTSRALADWKPSDERTAEVPFVVARILLQDFTGVPLLVDLAAMRSAVARLGSDPSIIEPLVPVDLVIDHSVQVDFCGTRRRAAAQHGDGVQAQPRALRVPQVGHAGVQRLQRRAARHRHLPPGQPRIPRQAASWRRTASSIPIRSSAPTRTPR